MAHLSDADVRLIFVLIEAGVLKPVSQMPQLNPQPRKSVYIGCADCDQLKSTMVFHGTRLNQKLHLVGSIHGGGAAFHASSPLNVGCPHSFPYKWFCWKIAHEACKLKSTDVVSWYSHAPCGAAATYGVTLAQLMELHFNNADAFVAFMKSEHGKEFRVQPFFHVDFQHHRGSVGQKDKRTFWTDKAAWLDFRSSCMDEIDALAGFS